MIRRINAALLGIALFTATFAQNTYSPYSSYGLGDINSLSSSAGRAMGKTGISLRQPNTINLVNPAAGTAQDTFSFVFDFGMSGIYKELSTKTQNETFKSGNIDHIVIGFPIQRWWYFNAGIMPYSGKKYSITSFDTIADIKYPVKYSATGNLNQAMLATSFKIGDFLSLGVKASYLFGVIERENILITSNFTEDKRTMNVHDIIFTGGLQAYNTFFDKHTFIFGLTYQPKTSVNIDYTRTILINNAIDNSNNIANSFTMPEKLGLGLTYIYADKLLTCFEYEQTNWSKYKFPDLDYQLKDMSSLRVGFEFTPERKSLKKEFWQGYAKRVSIRAGAQMTNTYLEINSHRITDRSITVGLGLPYKHTRSVFNISFEFGQHGTTDYGLVLENYKAIHFSFSAYDMWFKRSKFD